MPGTAFVTGGSGFIGGHLVRRMVGEGWSIRALARSDRAAERVAELGAEPVRGDLASTEAIVAGARGAELAFHLAAVVDEWAPRDHYVRTNVVGTENALRACRAAGVGRFLHLSTEAVLLAGAPLVDVDETAPLRPDSPSAYAATKAMAEKLVTDAAADGFATVAIRPRLVWGPGDATLLPGLVEAVRGRRFAWIGGGRHLTATTHVANVVEALFAAALRGRPGEAYFVTDGGPVVFRKFVTDLLATVGIEPPSRSIPAGLATVIAAAGERAWGSLPLPGHPPLTRMAVWLSALECTIDITKARVELGYTPVIDFDEGFAAMCCGAD